MDKSAEILKVIERSNKHIEEILTNLEKAYLVLNAAGAVFDGKELHNNPFYQGMEEVRDAQTYVDYIGLELDRMKQLLEEKAENDG